MNHREAVGARFDPARMQHARAQCWAALRGIRERMRPGISEEEARVEAMQVFEELGVQRLWHPLLIRIGANTLKHVGDTFVIGEAPERRACAEAARCLFDEVAQAWRTQGLSGRALYDFAAERAEATGWRFNHAIKGHRLSDYPHSVHKGGDLGTLDGRPTSGLWVLEIQIAHPTEPFGAFYEDLLTV